MLGSITSDPAQRERITRQTGVRSVTLHRWVTGESQPREQNLRQLLHAVPINLQEEFLQLLKEEHLDFSPLALQKTPREIPSSFFAEIHATRAQIPDVLRYWTISRQVLQHAIRQLDPDQQGMMLIIVECMPPRPDRKIHSLREKTGRGNLPWGQDLKVPMFLGVESLAGYAVTYGRHAQVQDLRERSSLFPTYPIGYEVSATAHPIQFSGRIAGCLLASSIQPNYFYSLDLLNLIQNYANLLALAFEPEQFYPQDIINLSLIPPLETQEKISTNFRQRVATIMERSFAQMSPITSVVAEAIAWQEIEAELLSLPRD
jgi:hypothetical protein